LFSILTPNSLASSLNKGFVGDEKNELLGEYISVKKGMDTGNNNNFLRYWHEVNFDKIGLDIENGEQTIISSLKWVPYDKGGSFRKWYGNNEYVVDWNNNGLELREGKANLRSKHLYFKKSITWSALTSSKTSFRYSTFNSIFDSAGSSMFPNSKELNYFLGLTNTKLINRFLTIINPNRKIAKIFNAMSPFVYVFKTSRVVFSIFILI
jgi:hypothetical protein